MKIKLIVAVLLMCLCLCACSSKEDEMVVNTAPPMEDSFVIPEHEQAKSSITFTLDGAKETVPACVYEGMDYTIVVPEGGWHMYEPGAWQSTFKQTVKFWVKGYNGDNAKKLIEQLSSEGYLLSLGGSVMSRSSELDKDRLIENVMIFRNGDSLRAVFYCYPESFSASFGARLDTIVNTFSWKDPQENATSGNMAGLTDAELQEALNGPAAIIETKEGQSPQAAQISLLISAAETKSKELEARLQNATSQTDMNISSGELYTLWDETINSVWTILRESMDEDEFGYLLDEQLDWIEEKEYAIQQAAAEYQGGSMASLAANQKATELTRERVYKLAEYLE